MMLDVGLSLLNAQMAKFQVEKPSKVVGSFLDFSSSWQFFGNLLIPRA
jgi:hypothetical protein